MVEIAQIKVSKDGNYSHTIIAEGSLWKNQGDYVCQSNLWCRKYCREQLFCLHQQSAVLETTDIFEVDAGNSGTFDIPYND